MSISSSDGAICVRRSSPYASATSRSSVLDEVEDVLLVAEQRAQLRDPLLDLGVLGLDLVRLERGELREAQVEDRRRLEDRELEPLDELVARGVAVARPADELDDRVEVVERDEEALEDVGAGLALGELVLRAADDDLALVLDVVLEDLAQRERLRHALDERDRVHAERRLHRRVLVEQVEHDARVGVALALDDQPHAAAVGVVVDVRDAGDLLVGHELRDARDEAALAALLDHEGQLGDDDRLLAAADLLDVGLRADPDAAAAGLVGVADALVAEDDPAGREVGALDVLLDQLLDRDLPGCRCRRSSRRWPRAGCAAGCSSPCRPRCRTSR